MEDKEIEKLKSIADKTDLSKFYDKLRKRIGGKTPDLEKSQTLGIRDFIFLLPDFFILLTRVLTDKRVPKDKKLIISCIIGYIIMPIDLIPDFIPVVGLIDDLIIAALGINVLLTEIDQKIIFEHWPGKANLLDMIKLLIFKIENNIQAPIKRRFKRLINKLEKSKG